ncbi:MULTISPECIES: PspA/IM30 family protein [unclassified Bacillus (in: firmicutes)]|uniref:PspA/IM30 family protein n=1 Tax=unclassified Bacillus (in: firmicutes) TaxID=185979 RepID=UPI0008E641DF|nr:MULTISPECIES: PspA/IM30 family protein [unclassified Bacillus (in: firmicutes)]SFI97317.1 Phage shock protein A [Bacillus sp. 71mf]SFS63751.1 Phage shock protein A [Bacillus sp. 103mf]
MKQSLFGRVRDAILADFHNVLDEKERKNPMAMLNQYLRNGEREITKIEKLIERHKTLKSNFARELEQARYFVNKRSKQAVIAKEAGEMQLHDRALEEVAYYEGQVARLEKMYAGVVEQIDELERRLSEMKNKLKEMNAKRMELMARENMAHASRRMNTALHKMDENNPFLRFEEIENHIRDLELRIHEDHERDTFDMKIAKLEREMKEKKEVSLTKESVQ